MGGDRASAIASMIARSWRWLSRAPVWEVQGLRACRVCMRQGQGAVMAVPAEVTTRLERALTGMDEVGARGTRLLEDARRLCGRVHHLILGGALPAETDSAAMQLCCYALQLPLKSQRASAAKMARPNLKERAGQAAEMLVEVIGDMGFDTLVEAATQILSDVHHKRPLSDQARLLADALNLEDFGVSGVILQAILLARQGHGVSTVADGYEKREQYGYWEARLKDGFHFEASRQIARTRLESARKVGTLLVAELKQDYAL